MRSRTSSARKLYRAFVYDVADETVVAEMAKLLQDSRLGNRTCRPDAPQERALLLRRPDGGAHQEPDRGGLRLPHLSW